MRILTRDASQAERGKPSKPPAAAAVARGVGSSVKERHECKEFLFVGGGRHHDAQLHQRGMQSGRSQRYFGDNRNLLAPSNKGRSGGRQAIGTADTDSRRNNHHTNLEMGIVLNKKTAVWLNSHMYPGESPGRRAALSSGSDCDAVWPCAFGV